MSPLNGPCTQCDANDFTLVREIPEFTQCTWDDLSGQFSKSIGKPSINRHLGDAVRFFCTNCRTYYPVPEELT